MPKRMRKATITQKSPVSSDRAKPRMVQKRCPLREGFLAQPMIKAATVPEPGPEPAPLTVAASAPINVVAVAMSQETTLVLELGQGSRSGELL